MQSNNVIYEEIKSIASHSLIWLTLGSQDIRLRYRRSTIGPFWITINMAITVISLGFLYGYLFKLKLDNYLPFLTSGIIGWSLISTLILESCNAFIESEKYIKNQDSFFSLFLMRLTLRNCIVFMHNLLVFIPIILIFHLEINFKILLLIPGLIIIGINSIFWGTSLAIIGTRYRDFNPIISSLMQVIFFLTPIIWMPNLLPSQLQWIVKYNPFNQLLNLIRAPMSGEFVDLSTILMVSYISVLGFLLYFYFLRKYKHRIVFWL